MTRIIALGLLAATVLTPAAQAQDAASVTLTPFAFDTIAVRNAGFDRSAYVYPDTHDLAGQVNPNTGDVRLDAVVIDGTVYDQSQLQLVTGARIVQDDAVDEERGGSNLTAGYGLGAELDPLLDEGPGSTTPTETDLRDAHGNFNLSSIVAVRENDGTAIYELSFDEPVDTLLLWERGNSGDILVAALDDAGNEIGSILVLDGAEDDGPSTWTPTGIVVTTYVQEGFLNQGQELSATGLRLSAPVSAFRFTAYQEPEGESAVRYEGPDLKVLALAGS